ncbi:MAG: hypothetical protein KDA86_27440, partial [Planctomycetaceae bacterium]|nr:hypothetical protein [Planctomycetaceae bacterium]
VFSAARRAGKGGQSLRDTAQRTHDAFAANLAPVVRAIREQRCVTLRAIAGELNDRGILTRRSGR